MPLHVCERCQYTTLNSSNYKRHLGRKHPCKPFGAGVGEGEVDGRGGLQTHERGGTRRNKKREYACGFCDKTFFDKSNLNRHAKKSSCQRLLKAKADAEAEAEANAITETGEANAKAEANAITETDEAKAQEEAEADAITETDEAKAQEEADAITETDEGAQEEAEADEGAYAETDEGAQEEADAITETDEGAQEEAGAYAETDEGAQEGERTDPETEESAGTEKSSCAKPGRDPELKRRIVFAKADASRFLKDEEFMLGLLEDIPRMHIRMIEKMYVDHDPAVAPIFIEAGGKTCATWNGTGWIRSGLAGCLNKMLGCASVDMWDFVNECERLKPGQEQDFEIRDACLVGSCGRVHPDDGKREELFAELTEILKAKRRALVSMGGEACEMLPKERDVQYRESGQYVSTFLSHDSVSRVLSQLAACKPTRMVAAQ